MGGSCVCYLFVATLFNIFVLALKLPLLGHFQRTYASQLLPGQPLLCKLGAASKDQRRSPPHSVLVALPNWGPRGKLESFYCAIVVRLLSGKLFPELLMPTIGNLFHSRVSRLLLDVGGWGCLIKLGRNLLYCIRHIRKRTWLPDMRWLGPDSAINIVLGVLNAAAIPFRT